MHSKRNCQDIQRFTECLFQPDDLIEVRLLPSGQSSWQQAQHLHCLADRFSKQNLAGQNVYFGANPRNSKGGKTEHVKLARSLCADFDHTNEASVRERLAQTGFPEPTVIVNSGHGVHCYWRLDEPMEDLARWTQIQKRLARLLGSDPKVCDPPRILRLPAFKNHKEPAAKAELLEASPERVYSLDDLEGLLPPPAPLLPIAPRNDAPGAATLEARAIAYLAKCEPSIAGQHGHDRAFTTARAVVYGFDLGIDTGLQLLLAHYNQSCQPPWSERELRRKCEEADSKPYKKPRGWLLMDYRKDKRGKPGLDHDQPEGDEPYSDLWNARKMIERYGQDLRFVASWGKWLVWDGIRWRCDEDGEAMRRAKATVDYLLEQAELSESEAMQADGDNAKADKAQAKADKNHAKQSANAARLRAMVELASTEPGIPLGIDQLNQHSHLLNCPNGTLDLRTGTLRPAERADLLTKLCPTPFDPSASCPRWEAFLDEIMAGNRLLIDYLARAAGYSLTGSIGEHALFFAHGTGANGKSVFLGTLQTVLGSEYSMQAMPELLMTRHGERHPTELADLYGMRLTVINETEQDRQLAESLLKQLTGGDRIRARRMRQDFWEFSPTHKLWLAGNHRPKIRGQDHGIWRRLHLIPFQVTIPPEKQDKSLGAVLASEASGILAWAVRGCLAWQREGLNPPPEVLEATASYRQEQDDLGAFLEECCFTGPAYSVASSALLESFSNWLGTGKPPTRNGFATTMEAKGFEKQRSSTTGKWMWQGITLRPDVGHG
ncbi:MAG TPA: phage/plasmid primase, P4 family [Gemmatales bacterium]|nr:phage/plasmid primase, P4 family [Gemmatales bacterium]